MSQSSLMNINASGSDSGSGSSESKSNKVDYKSLYINQLSILEKKTLEIAKDHLQSSFSIEESIGFKEWLKKI